MLVSAAAAHSKGLKIPGFLDASAVVLPESEPFPVAADSVAFLNVNVLPGPVLPGGLKVKPVLGLGDSLTSSPAPTRRSKKWPSASS